MLDYPQLAALSSAHNRIALPDGYPSLFEAQGYRWVCSPGHAVQTAMQIAQPQKLVLENHRAMLLAALLVPSVSAVLDLGMGGGACLRHVSGVYPQSTVTAVELDATMVQLARDFFALPVSQPVHIGDATAFLAQDSGSYDLVLCDVFAGREAPLALHEPAFYAALASRVTSTGTVALNTLPASEQALSAILLAAKRAFAGIGIVQFAALGNVVLLLQHHWLPSTEILLERLALSAYAGDPSASALLETLVRFE